MQGTIHMHSKLNGNVVSCSATALTNLWDTDRSYPTTGGWNDAFFPVHQVFDRILNKKSTSTDFTDANWEQQEISSVYSAQASHYADTVDKSDYDSVYNFTLCIKCINRDTTSTWTKPKYLQCQFQIKTHLEDGDDDYTFAGRLIAAFVDQYRKFIISVWPKPDAPNYWDSHKCSEFFQITCCNCNIVKLSEAWVNYDCVDTSDYVD